MTELNQIGAIDGDDPNYHKAKAKLDRLKKESRIVVVVAKEASRGVDFQFKPGSPSAHIILNFHFTRTSELIQAIGRSCRQLGQEMPSWRVSILDKAGNYNDDYVLKKVEGKEDNLSMLASTMWHSMALLLDELSHGFGKKRELKQEALDALFTVAHDLGASKFKKESDFFLHVVNCGIPSRLVDDTVIRLRKLSKCCLSPNCSSLVQQDPQIHKTLRQQSLDELNKKKAGRK